MNTITITEPQQSKPEVLTLAEQIGALHRDIKSRYAEIHALLTQAKKETGKGGWTKWLADNREVLGFGERQAQLYLRPPELRSSDQKARAADQKQRRANLHVVPTPPKSLPTPTLKSPVVKLDPDGQENIVPLKRPEPAKPPRATEPDQIIPVEPTKLEPNSKRRWSELTPNEREELRRIERVEALLANLEVAADQIAEAASELSVSQQERVAAVVKRLMNVVPSALVAEAVAR